MNTDLAAEQAFIDGAYAWLAWMRVRAEELAAGVDPKDLDLVHALRRRVAALTDSGGRPLCFGRIDQEAGRCYVGRRHVEDAAATRSSSSGGRPSPCRFTGPARARLGLDPRRPPVAADGRRPLDGRRCVRRGRC